MGIKSFLKNVVFNNEALVASSTEILPTRLTIVDGNSFFYGGGGAETAEDDGEEFRWRELAGECKFMKARVDEFRQVFRKMERTCATIPLADDTYTTIVVSFDGRPPCLKWKTQKHRMRTNAAGGGLKPWSEKSIHLSRFLDYWMNCDRTLPTELTFRKYYDNVIVGDLLLPGEGDYKISHYVLQAFEDGLIRAGDVVTVVTDDSDMVCHLLHAWAVPLGRACEIQIYFKRKPAFVLRMSEFARFCALPEGDKAETYCSNLFFMLQMCGNDYVPQLAGFPLTMDRFEVMMKVASRASERIYKQKDIFVLAMNMLDDTTAKRGKNKKFSRAVDDFSVAVARNHFRAMMWGVGYYRHVEMPWFAAETVDIANAVDASFVAPLDLASFRESLSALSDDDFAALSKLEFYVGDDSSSFEREVWYLSYLYDSDDRLSPFTVTQHNVKLAGEAMEWLRLFDVHECHFDRDSNRFVVKTSIPLHQVVVAYTKKISNHLNSVM